MGKYTRQITITAILITLLVFFMFLSPGTFLSSRIYVAYMSTIPFSAIMALGITLIVVSGDMDLSFPAVMALSGFVFASLFELSGSVFISLLGALAAGIVAGLFNAFFIVKLGVPSIIATIGTQFFWRGLVVLLAGGLAKNISDIREEIGSQMLTWRVFDLIPMQFIWLLFLSVIFWIILNKHVIGDNIRFVGDNDQAAEIMGISVAKTRTLVFVMMGICSSLAGVLVCCEMANWWPTQGEGYMLIVFASVFIGGTSVFGGEGTIYGTVIGSIIIGIIEAGLISAGAQGFWTRLVYGIIVLGAVSSYALMSKNKK